jgi:hypothetical protein
MLFHVGNAVAQLSQFFPGRRRIDSENRICRLGGGIVMRPGTNPAYPGGNPGHLFDGSADTEFLKASQFKDIDLRIADVSRVIELDGDPGVSFDSCDWLNSECFSHDLTPFR